jgi:glucosylceramidase
LVAPVAVGLALLAPQSSAQTASAISVQVVQTTPHGSERMAPQPSVAFAPQAPAGIPVIEVEDQVAYQQVDGFGAAMTDSSAWLLEDELAPQSTSSVMKMLFSPASGIGIDFLRVPIGASDFTRTEIPYSYDDLPPGRRDPRLRHFSIAHDLPYVIPSLRQALAVDPQLQIIASPWSPPGWMKANQRLDNEHHLGTLLPSDYAAWARYFVRFIESYAQQGVPVAAVTPQNEPGNATVYPGLQLGSAQEISLIRRYLAPALRAAHLSTRIYAGDVSVSHNGRFAIRVLRSSARAAISGLAWHCYFGTAFPIGVAHRLAPGLQEIGDECAPGVSPLPMPEVLISELRNWASVVTFFNVAENTVGGPVQPPNRGCGGCTPLVTVNERTHQPTPLLNYYELGQASAFIEPGARRIDSNHFVSYSYVPHHPPHVSPGIDDVAVENPDGSRVLLAYNTSPAPLRFAVHWRDGWFQYLLPAGATVTFRWSGGAG